MGTVTAEVRGKVPLRASRRESKARRREKWKMTQKTKRTTLTHNLIIGEVRLFKERLSDVRTVPVAVASEKLD